MRMLDIDLDFFLNDIAYGDGNSTMRLPEGKYRPWTANRVRRFLETQFGLSTTNPIPGKRIIHHHEAFFFWRDLIEQRRLDMPFDLIHVDAHADFGYGYGEITWKYIGEYLVHRQVDARRYCTRRMNAGNYISFVLACRWLRSLVFVAHPKTAGGIYSYYVKDYHFNRDNSGLLQLKVLKRGIAHGDNSSLTAATVAVEPEILYQQYRGNNFIPITQVDFLTLSHSPGFTPPSADRLLDVISEYFVDTDAV